MYLHIMQLICSFTMLMLALLCCAGSSPYSPMRVSMASRMAAAGVPNSIASRMPSEQQEAATAVAYVSVNGGSRAGEGNGRGDGSPRTRLRLNHVQPRSPGGQRAAPVLPEFIHVEEDVPPGAAVVSAAWRCITIAPALLCGLQETVSNSSHMQLPQV